MHGVELTRPLTFSHSPTLASQTLSNGNPFTLILKSSSLRKPDGLTQFPIFLEILILGH